MCVVESNCILAYILTDIWFYKWICQLIYRLWLSSGQVYRVWGRGCSLVIQPYLVSIYMRIRKEHNYFEILITLNFNYIVQCILKEIVKNIIMIQSLLPNIILFTMLIEICNFTCLLWGWLSTENNDNLKSLKGEETSK